MITYSYDSAIQYLFLNALSRYISKKEGKKYENVIPADRLILLTD